MDWLKSSAWHYYNEYRSSWAPASASQLAPPLVPSPPSSAPLPPLPPAVENEIRIKKLTIKLENGDVTEAEADILVNSTGSEINLSDGKLASSMLRKAGNRLQRECSNLAPIQHEQVVASQGYNLKCQKVYHCCCPSSFSVKSLKNIITKCMTMASEAGYTSMVIPPIGTGKLKYPPEDVVAAIVAAAGCFLSEYSKESPLRVITLMVHDMDTKCVKAFEEYFEENFTQPELLAELDKDTDPIVVPDVEKTMELKEKSDLPDNWQHPLDSYMKVDIEDGTEEWLEVESDFLSTFKSQVRVTEVIRVQNPMTFRQYTILKDHVSKQLKNSNFIVEQTLWHGTPEENVEKITTSFFDRGFAGTHGKQYGAGCYFSTTSQYSHDYSSRSNCGRIRSYNRIYHMIRARVISGEYCQGNGQMKNAPLKNNSNTAQYNSVVNQIVNPTIFVTFQDASAYPEYIVKYKLL